MVRYYSIHRPIAPGSFPKPENNRREKIVNFDKKIYCAEIEREAYGYIEYEYALGDEAEAYELVPEITLENLGTEFERRRVFEYGKDGNKVVRHWYNMQHVAENLYKGEEWADEYGNVRFNLYAFLPDCHDGVLVGKCTHPDWYKKAATLERLKSLGYTSSQDFIVAIKKIMEAGSFVGGVDIAFIRQFDPAFADECSAYRLARLKAQNEKRELQRQEEIQREREKDAEKQQAIEAEKARYFGWADTLTPMQYGRAKKLLEKAIRYKGKVTTPRDLVISLVQAGHVLYKKEYNSSNIVYGLSEPNTHTYVELKKTEYDFAEYLINHKDVLAS